MQKQNPAAASKKARRSPQRRISAPPLTVTLDAQASACVRRFAEEFGEDVRDVASGGILDTLPQALEEWEDTKQRREKGESDMLTYWQGTEEEVRDARKRRAAKQVQPPDAGAEALTITLDPEASALVRWANLTFGRRAGDSASAAVIGTLQHAREEYEAQTYDNSVLSLIEYLAETGNRRIAKEDAASAGKS